jgi:hypothetical protein
MITVVPSIGTFAHTNKDGIGLNPTTTSLIIIFCKNTTCPGVNMIGNDPQSHNHPRCVRTSNIPPLSRSVLNKSWWCIMLQGKGTHAKTSLMPVSRYLIQLGY